MTTITYNLTAVRKTIGAIHHRLDERDLDHTIRARIIARQLEDLLETLPANFHELIHACHCANHDRDYQELLEGLELLASLLPPFTYGAVPAGVVFTLEHGATYYTKRKHGAEAPLSLFPHFPPDTIVRPVNY